MELQGKVAFITGAAKGMGKGHAEALLERGAKVFLGDVNSTIGAATFQEFQERFGKERVRFVAFDVSNRQQFNDAFSQAVSEFGQVDIMVNNAGIVNESDWESVINVNFTGVVTGTRLATEHMRKDKGGHGGRIINVSSLAGLENYYYFPVYTGSKHAVRAFTSSLADQPNIEEQGVEYGILCPDAVATDIIHCITPEMIYFFDEYKSTFGKLMPVSQAVNAFLQLLQLEKMNGSILYIGQDKNSFQKVEHHAI